MIKSTPEFKVLTSYIDNDLNIDCLNISFGCAEKLAEFENSMHKIIVKNSKLANHLMLKIMVNGDLEFSAPHLLQSSSALVGNTYTIKYNNGVCEKLTKLKTVIKFEDMVAALAKNGQAVIDGLTPESAHMLHMAVGVTGEIGELIENYFDNGCRENQVEELGDIEFYYKGIELITGNVSQDHDLKDPLLIHTLPHQLLKLALHGSALLDAVKKYSIYEKELDAKELINQMIQVRIWLGKIYTTHDITRDEAIIANITKLGERYSSGSYSNNQATTRADKIA